MQDKCTMQFSKFIYFAPSQHILQLNFSQLGWEILAKGGKFARKTQKYEIYLISSKLKLW